MNATYYDFSIVVIEYWLNTDIIISHIISISIKKSQYIFK